MDKLELLKQGCKNTLMEHLGIEFTEMGDDYLCAKMPVNSNTHQPYGLLHGGASVALAESVGSAGSSLFVDPSKQYPVGLEINANHVRSISSGWVFAKGTLVHKGRTTHIWEIRITTEEGKLVCVSRMTNAILDRK